MRRLSFALVVDPDALNAEWTRELSEALTLLEIHCRVIAADERLDLSLRACRPEGVLIAATGRAAAGEIQQLCEMRGIPYSGAGPASCALAFDKVRSRQLLAFHNLPVPAAVALGSERRVDKRAIELLGWPCVLKPRRGCDSEGVTRIDAFEEIEDALTAALEVDDELVLERAVDGIELQVVCFDDRVLGVMEVGNSERGLEMHCPPRVSRARLDGVTNLGRAAITALGVDRGFSRVDILLSPRHNEVILEVEACPPVHSGSVVRRIANAMGFSWLGAWAQIAAPLAVTARTRRASSTRIPLQ